MSRYNKKHNRSNLNRPDKHEPAIELTPTQEELLRQTRKPITVRQRDGSEQTTTVRDAIIQKYIQTAANGSPHALNQVTQRMDAAEIAEAEMIKDKIDKGILMREYFQSQLEEFTASEREQGVSEEDLNQRIRDYYPHPDDVIVHEKGYRLTGPYDEKSLKRYHYIMKVRDANILQHALDTRCDKKADSEVGNECDQNNEDDLILLHGVYVHKDILEQRSALLFANTYNSLLPERFKITESDLIMKLMMMDRLTKRDLLRECHQAWAALDINLPRGWLSPTFTEGSKSIQLLYKISEVITDNAENVRKFTDEMWLEQISEIAREIE
jgi:hypothetical protein